MFAAKWAPRYIFCLFIFIIVFFSGFGIDTSYSQHSNCPEVQLNFSDFETPLFYFLTDGTQLTIDYINKIDIHNTDIWVKYPPGFNDVRARISPAGTKVAFLFINSSGDPSTLSPQAVLTIVNLVTQTVNSNNIELEEYDFLASYGSSGVLFGLTWFARDISWDWLNDTSLVFNLPSKRQIFDTESQTLITNTWPEYFWTDSQQISSASEIALARYSLFLKTSKIDQGVKQVAVVNSDKGESVHDNFAGSSGFCGGRRHVGRKWQ